MADVRAPLLADGGNGRSEEAAFRLEEGLSGQVRRVGRGSRGI